MQQLGRYELIYLLGQGGMGEVHLARLRGAAGFEKLCIVKTILPQRGADPQFLDRFRHEAKLLVQLTHSNIAQVYDMGDEGGQLYMAIEYVAGVDLSRVQGRIEQIRKKMPLPIALALGQKMAEALGYAHRKVGPTGSALGIVHRDVSPHNCMVSYEGEVKVIDFGLAKSAGRSQHTLPATVMGKLGYMSPEQVRGEPVDARTDIYSCGVVVWELIAGQPMFAHGTAGEMMARMSNPQIPALKSIRPEVSIELERAVARALAVSARDRYARAKDFARALNEVGVRERLSAGAEEVGTYVKGLCVAEYAEERKLMSRLSLEKSGQPRPAPNAADSGTAIRSPSPPPPPPLATPAPPPAPLPIAPVVKTQPVLAAPQAVAAPAPPSAKSSKKGKGLGALGATLVVLGVLCIRVCAQQAVQSHPASMPPPASVPLVETDPIPPKPAPPRPARKPAYKTPVLSGEAHATIVRRQIHLWNDSDNDWTNCDLRLLPSGRSYHLGELRSHVEDTVMTPKFQPFAFAIADDDTGLEIHCRQGDWKIPLETR